jgi:hypothetical protein
MSRLTRAITFLFAAVQFALPAVASVADGAAAAGGRNSAAHIESKGDRDCKPPHTADCAICRFLSATHSQTRSAATVELPVGKIITPEALVLFSPTSARRGFNSRAPPIVLG